MYLRQVWNARWKAGELSLIPLLRVIGPSGKFGTPCERIHLAIWSPAACICGVWLIGFGVTPPKDLQSFAAVWNAGDCEFTPFRLS
jgi:hypothetical protein